MGRVKRIWYLLPMRAATVQVSLRICAVSPEPRCSLIQAVSQEEPSDRKPDPWLLWMAGHGQLKFVMTECSKTQIRLTGLKWIIIVLIILNIKLGSVKRICVFEHSVMTNFNCACPAIQRGQGCTGSPEPSLLAWAISTKFAWRGPNVVF